MAVREDNKVGLVYWELFIIAAK